MYVRPAPRGNAHLTRRPPCHTSSSAQPSPCVRYGHRVPQPSPTTLPPDTHDRVISWFTREGRDLPWRKPEASPWSILVSEIMLQQTPVVRVLPRWQEWMQRWPTPHHLADAKAAEVLRVWDRLGYPRRALRLQECARAIVRDHGGVVPSEESALRALPGIGEYTAAAVAAFAFGQRSVVADTNIRRVLIRAITGQERPAPSYTSTERTLVASHVPTDAPQAVRWNQAIMELGALVCTARSPHCDECPLRRDCAWHAAGRPTDPSAPRRTQAFVGTDRQMRGQIMAVLREHGEAKLETLLALDPNDAPRVHRCLTSLLRDGLAVPVSGSDGDGLPARVALPS